MDPSTAKECAWGWLWWCTTSKGENFLGCPSLAERSRVSLCEKCRPTPRSSYLSLLPFSTTLSADFTSAPQEQARRTAHFIREVGRGL